MARVQPLVSGEEHLRDGASDRRLVLRTRERFHHVCLHAAQADDQLLERFGVRLHRRRDVGEPGQGGGTGDRPALRGRLDRLHDGVPPRLARRDARATRTAHARRTDEGGPREGPQDLVAAPAARAGPRGRCRPGGLGAPAGLAQDEGGRGAVLAAGDVLAAHPGQQQGHRRLTDAVVVRVDRGQPGRHARAGVGVVEPDHRLVPRQHQAGGPQRALEADRVPVRRRDRRRRRGAGRQHAGRGVRAALLVVVRRLVDPAVRRLDAVVGERRAVGGEPLAHVPLRQAADEADRRVPVPEQVLDGGAHPAEVVGQDDGVVTGLRLLAHEHEGQTPLLHGGEPVAAQRLADDDEAVDGTEGHGRVEDRLVRVPLPVEPRRVRLHRDHAMSGRPRRSCHPGDQGTEVEPADHRREHTDRPPRRR